MKTKPELTFKHNLERGRHGWLRLTPAYSVKIVHEILDAQPATNNVLDPFSGTGTTGLVCAERGLQCDLLDINPFLVWLARVKTANYSPEQLAEFQNSIPAIVAETRKEQPDPWHPPISDIERWWSSDVRNLLARLYQTISNAYPQESAAKDLLLIAFCKCLINWSNAAFNHQSVSFKPQQATLFGDAQDELLLDEFTATVAVVLGAARQGVKGRVNVIQADARQIPENSSKYDCVITSPPYPNRMSYIRELRPYMYWLKYLSNGREAGELDWQAIGGTWGIATSRIAKWRPSGTEIPFAGFENIVEAIASKSQLLGNYVHKYFADVLSHVTSLFPRIISGGKVFYIIGNSKFYQTLVPVEEIYAEILRSAGFVNPAIECIRKRNSKKELYEFIVSAQKP
jgi:16S rRNA G966 N2-methylase RsmD